MRRRRLAARRRRRRRPRRGAAAGATGAWPSAPGTASASPSPGSACWSWSPAWPGPDALRGRRPHRCRRRSPAARSARPPGCSAPARSAPTRCPTAGSWPPSASACWPAAIVLVVAAAVMMGTARGAAHRRPCARCARRTTQRAGRQEVHGDRGVAPARPPDRRGAGHERRRGGHARPLDRSPRCAPPAPRCGSAARRPPRSCSASPPPAPTSARSASPPGSPRWPTAARSPQLRRATAGADLVHAHGLRAGLVAAAARRLAGERRPAARAHPAQRPAGERGPAAAAAAGGRGADHPRRRPRARRLQRPGRQRPPARRPRRPGRARRSRRRCRPATRTPRRGPRGARASTTAGRWSSPSAGCTRRRATTSCSTPSRAGSADGRLRPAPLVAIAGDGPLEDELAARIARRAAAGPAARPARRRRRPARRRRRSACCPRGGRAARSPPRRRCAPARRWSPPAPAASPSWSAPAPSWCRWATPRRSPTPSSACSATPRTPPGWPRPAARQAASWPDEAAAGAAARRRLPRAARRAGRRAAVSRWGRARGRAPRRCSRCCSGSPSAAAAARGRRRGRRPRRSSSASPGSPGTTSTPTARRSCGRWPRTPPIGALSVRAARSTTCVLDGWATLGAGNRARVPGPGRRPAAGARCRPCRCPDDQAAPTATPDGTEPRAARSTPRCPTAACRSGRPSVALADPEATVARTAEDEGTARFGAEPGALGEAVGCATVSGRAATLAVAVAGRASSTRVDDLPDRRRPSSPACSPAARSPSSRSTSSPTPGSPGVDADRRRHRPGAAGGGAAADRRAPWAGCAPPSTTLHGDTLLLLAGISEVNDGRPQLHVGHGRRARLRPAGWLTSASTGRAPFAQLIDLAPDGAAGARPGPAGVDERPADAVHRRRGPALARGGRTSSTDVNTARDGAPPQHRRLLLDAGARLGGARRARHAACSAALRGRPARRARAPGRRLAARAGRRRGGAADRHLPRRARAVGALRARRCPRWSPRVLAADLVVAAVALLGPWRRAPARARRSPSSPSPSARSSPTCSPARRWSSTGCSATTRSSPAGSPATATSPSGCMSVSALQRHRRRWPRSPAGGPAPTRARLATGGTVLVLGFLTVGVIGAPGLGRDFGGVLAALPGLPAAGDAAGAGAGDRRPAGRGPRPPRSSPWAPSPSSTGCARPADRSHLGRFVEQVLTGEAWTVISRKGAGQPRHPAAQPARLDAAGRARRGGLAGAPRRPAAQPAGRRGGRRRPGCRPSRCSSSASVLLSALLSLVLGRRGQRLRASRCRRPRPRCWCR